MNRDAATSTPHAPEQHQPYVPASKVLPELSFSAVLVGAVLGIIFGASSLYLVLKVGMTVSASIPIAVLSITIFRVFTRVWPFSIMFRRDATILENNIVQTTGSAGESIAFGVGVTMPALMILGYELELTRVMLVAVLGGLLGILMMIPLRRAFIVKQHGRLVYPEGTACAEVLIVGEKGGATARTVFVGFGLAFVYQFAMSAARFWKEIPERTLQFFKGASLSLEASPALLGVGYIIGTRISCIMVAGGVLASWVLIPAIVLFGSGLTEPLFPAEMPISQMSLDDIWHNYILYIGAGAVAAGGIISMLQALPMILSSVRSGVGDLVRAGAGGGGVRSVLRTDRDLSMKFVILGCLGLVIAIWAAPMLNMNVVGAALIVLFGFLFVTVSSRLTGEIGSSSNPISGMTVATLLLTCLIFLTIGWTGESHRLTALSIAGIVCIAASNGGTTSQDLKTGYLVGGTPRHQQIGILAGALTSSLVIGWLLLWFNDNVTIYSKKDLPTAIVDVSTLHTKQRPRGEAAADEKEYFVLHATLGEIAGVPAGKYLVDEDGKIQYLVDPGINGRLKVRDDGTEVTKFTAPKATLMSFIIDGILTQKLPWSLVLLGVAIALVLELSGIPSLPFAVGVYLPLSASTPIFVGGMVRWLADKWSRRGSAESEMSGGILLSSGLIAGGTIAAIVANFMATNKTIADSMNIGPRIIGAISESDGLPLLPFGVLALVLLLVGADKLLRTNENGSR